MGIHDAYAKKVIKETPSWGTDFDPHPDPVYIGPGLGTVSIDGIIRSEPHNIAIAIISDNLRQTFSAVFDLSRHPYHNKLLILVGMSGEEDVVDEYRTVLSQLSPPDSNVTVVNLKGTDQTDFFNEDVAKVNMAIWVSLI